MFFNRRIGGALCVVAAVCCCIGRIVAADAGPHETQSAQCTITAGDVRASAQATISKQLDGVCGSVQLARSFELLEVRLQQQLSDIKQSLLHLTTIMSQSQPQNYHQNQQHPPIIAAPFGQSSSRPHGPPIVGNYMQLVPVISKPPPPSQSPPTTTMPTTLQLSTPLAPITPDTSTENNTLTTSTTAATPTPISTPSTSTASITNTTTDRTIHFRPVKVKSLSVASNMPPAASLLRKSHRSRSRELEVARFNNTLLSGDEIRIFSYYWRIEDFQRKLLANVTQIDSPVFSISGLHLRVRAVLNHLNRDYLFLQLQSLPHQLKKPHSGDRNDSGYYYDDDEDNGADDDDDDDDSDVVLESGTKFRGLQTKELFRHKIAILDQETPTKDLVSQEFINTASGFPVPNSAIVAGPYAKDSTILIKVVIYL